MCGVGYVTRTVCENNYFMQTTVQETNTDEMTAKR